METADGTFVVGGTAKGSGMIEPNMATMLGVLTTDARVPPALLAGDLLGPRPREPLEEYELVILAQAVPAAVLLFVPVGLIARQPDLGTAVLIFASGCYVLFLAGLSWRIIAGISIAGIASLPFVWSVLHDYQRQRVLTLLDPMQVLRDE